MTVRDGASIAMRLLRRAGWAPISVLLCHFVLSRGLGLYKTFPPLDIPVHLAGGLAVAYFVTRAFAAIPEDVVACPHRALLSPDYS